MVGMIEQINGTGLSGILGKSGKSAKGGLFAKLMAMLDKQGQGKGKGLFTATEPDALALKKGKFVAKVAEQDPLTKKKATENGTAVATVLFAGEKVEAATKPVKGEKATFIIGNPEAMNQRKKGEQSQFTIGKPDTTVQPGKGEKAEFTIGKPETATQLVKGEKAELTIGKPETATQLVKGEKAELTIGKPETATQLVKGEKAELTIGKPETATQLVKGEKAELTIGKPETATQLVKGEKAESTIAKTETSAQLTKDLNPAEAAASGLVKEGQRSAQKAATTAAANHDAKTIAANTATHLDVEVKETGLGKTSNGAAFAAAVQNHLQGKNAHGQPQQSAVQASAAATVVQNTIAEASTPDAGSQSSDKGAQDGRAMSAMSGDSRSGATASAGNTQFQSYLTSKAAPVMSVFDSMNHIAHSASNGQTKLEIQLDPAHLGKIQITLQTDASKQLQVHMVVDQGTTRAAIDQQLPVLRAALAQQGFDLSGFSMGSQSQESGFGSDSSGSGSAFAKSDETGSKETQTAQSMQQPVRTAESGLSIRV
ncbi:hypothetical protein F3F93_11235 [Mariprofundus sp. KV]|nr:hypothetical protein [Mariprofundus sp. KV]